MTTPVLLFILWLQSVSLAPVAHLVQNGDQRLSPLREAVLHLGRDLGILLPVDQLIRLQFLQCGAEGLVGDPPIYFFISLNRTTPKHMRV